MKAFVEAAGEKEYVRGLMLRILLGTGMSAGELINLSVEDFTLARGYVIIRSPGTTQSRKLHLAEPLQKEIWDYIEGGGRGPLFGRVAGKRRTLERVRRLVAQTGKEAGIEQRVNAADIRWTIERLLREQGASRDEALAFLGYKTDITHPFTSPAGVFGLLME